MSIISTVLCKTAGIAGMSAVLYDAYSVGSANSKRYSSLNNADYFEKIHDAQRTLSTESPTNNAIQKKVADLRYNNPIVPAYGKVKGFVNGTLKSLGDNLIPVSFAALALATKGFFSKVGAFGVVGCGLVSVLREGFGFGKTSPKV